MKAIIHAGIPKTGSSAIQKVLHDHPPKGVYYPPKPYAPNHSGLLALLFQEPIESFHGFQKSGRSRDELLVTRSEQLRILTAEIQSGKFDTMVLSAEYISTADPSMIKRMFDFLAPMFDEFQVIAYVRPPVSLMQSRFQQQVKGFRGRLNSTQLWPQYRSKLEKLDTIFGRDNVTLRKFHRTALKNGDVVQDFAHATGITLAPGYAPIRANESLSLEATCLLFAQRKLSKGFVSGFTGAPKYNNAFIESLSQIGTQKLLFSSALLEPILAKNQQDLDWIETRMGCTLLDAPQDNGARTITSESDLLAVAWENHADLADLVKAITNTKNAPDSPPKNDAERQQQTLRNLEILRAHHYAPVRQDLEQIQPSKAESFLARLWPHSKKKANQTGGGMKAIIHAGIPKTGSSAIQKVLHDHPPKGVYYPPKPYAPNHSGLLALLFQEPIESFHGFQKSGRSRDELLITRSEQLRRLTAEIQSGKFETMVLSAEYISNADPSMIKRMFDFLAPMFDEFQVIAYVRPPVSLMQSRFQQQVKGLRGRLNPTRLWPQYRASLEKLDTIFGRDNVTLRKFHRTALIDGDIVRDFAHATGITLAPGYVPIRANESLSLEATCLLFAQRELGKGFVSGFTGAPKYNNAFIESLSQIGTQKLLFSSALLEPILAKNQQDLDWIETRMGCALLDAPQDNGARTITSESDLLAVAWENHADLADLVKAITNTKNAPDSPPKNDAERQQQTLGNLEILRAHHYEVGH